MEESISLQEIFKIIKKRLLLIICLAILAVSTAYVLNSYYITPIYQAQTQILVNQKPTSEEAYSWSQMETDLQLINTYNVIIKSPVILNKVVEELELDSSSDQLINKIIVSNESDSKVVNIRVEDQNPEQAVAIANTVAEVFKKEIPSLMSVDNITILAQAKLSENPSPIKPNKMLNLAIAAVIGLMLGIALAFLREMLDTTIKSESDIEKILELPIMGLVGSIPLEKVSRANDKSQRGRRV
ncbi:YveK family protein [Lysinibacillus sp. 54212]|uniref:YveK family protein n=1 Tax=Lysinibacillus sp. 54212 TaxID=3119829 RepID=UPI002FCCA2DA